jgi:hypothetical protein
MNTGVGGPVASLNVRNVGSFGNSNSGGAAGNLTKSVSQAASGVGDFFLGWGGMLLVVILLVGGFALYYETVGYYFQLGWSKLHASHNAGESVQIQVPGSSVVANLQPAAGPSSMAATGSSISGSLSGAVQSLESDVAAALGGVGGKQVFNVARNLYTYAEAEPLCKAFGAELATYDQVKAAYESGADWCNYGWAKGQLAVYPTQQATYDKLQGGPEDQRGSCGVPGVNGGFFPNADQRFGVNCYGARPTETPLDERNQFEAKHETAFDREVSRFRAELPSIAVNPWNGEQWSS